MKAFPVSWEPLAAEACAEKNCQYVGRTLAQPDVPCSAESFLPPWNLTVERPRPSVAAPFWLTLLAPGRQFLSHKAGR